MDWVLIVGDETTDVEFAGHTLAKSGIRVTSLASGAELLDYLEENASVSPDLILMDVSSDGFDTLKKLREPGIIGFDIPVILLSDQGQASETLALQLGAIDFIRRPFAPDVLVGRVRNALRTHEKMQQFEREAMLDSMTGFLNKNSAEEKIKVIVAKRGPEASDCKDIEGICEVDCNRDTQGVQGATHMVGNFGHRAVRVHGKH